MKSSGSIKEARYLASMRWLAKNPGYTQKSQAAWKKANPGRQEAMTKAWKAKRPALLREYVRLARYKRVEYRQQLIKNGKCAHCGFSDHRGLEWAHKHTSKKVKTVGAWNSWKGMLAEIKRCFILCATCHRVYDYPKKESRRERQKQTAFKFT